MPAGRISQQNSWATRHLLRSSGAQIVDAEIKAEAKLEALDSFLRRIWLECCGHLSALRIGTIDYFSRGYEFGAWTPFGELGRQRPVERSMNSRIGDALPAVGECFGYEYDFGSTTRLKIKVVGERMGRLGRSHARLLMGPCFNRP
jgi:hypothetical protein